MRFLREMGVSDPVDDRVATWTRALSSIVQLFSFYCRQVAHMFSF